MNIYTHIGYSEKAEAVNKLPPIHIVRQKQAKTGTADVPENFSTNFSGNPIKTHKDTVKSIKGGNCVNEESENVTTLKCNELQDLSEMGVLGFEPRTYALKVRCSTY